VPLFGDAPVSYRTLLRKAADLEAGCMGQEAGTGQDTELAGRDTGWR
jgi:hypothetical protein